MGREREPCIAGKVGLELVEKPKEIVAGLQPPNLVDKNVSIHTIKKLTCGLKPDFIMSKLVMFLLKTLSLVLSRLHACEELPHRSTA